MDAAPARRSSPWPARWLAACLAVAAGTGAGFWAATAADLPEIGALETWKPQLPTRLVDRNGRELKTLYVERREWVDYARFPKHLVDAVLAIEDRQFFLHGGINWKGIARAVLVTLKTGEVRQGGSSITQQLAKRLFLTPEKTLRRKLREAWLAWQIERRYSKERILELYLNQIYLGSGNYGMAAAARSYFGKAIEDLTVDEAALLAGLAQAPSAYSPRNNPDKAKARRDRVLEAMVEARSIPRIIAEGLKERPVRVPERRETALAPYFVEEVRQRLEKILADRYGEERGEAMLYGGGLTVHTTLDIQFQEAAESSVGEGLAAYRRRHRIPEDSFEPLADFPQAALLTADVRTGDVLALVGGSDYGLTPYNRVFQMHRQPGSAFKPILYAAALMQGSRPSDVVWDTEWVIPTPGKLWRPQNYTGDFLGPMTLRRALRDSRNLPAVRTLQKSGIPPVQQMARRLGIRSPVRPELASALGVSEATLAELTLAYGAFANGGIVCRPRLIERLASPDGRMLYQDPLQCRGAMPPQEAFVMTDLLRNVIAGGTAKSAARLLTQSDLAGKTGTTNDNVDAWFIGYSPQWVTGVWIGYDRPRPMGLQETGGGAALPIWASTMSALLPQAAVRWFPEPEGIEWASIDPVTGWIDSEGERSAFVEGTAPRATVERTPAVGGRWGIAP